MTLRPVVLRQVALTTLREFVRSKEAVFWTYGFPVLMAIVLGLAFGRSGSDPSRVAVVQSETSSALMAALAEHPWLEARTLAKERARRALQDAEVDLVLAGAPGQWELWYDEQRAASRLARFAVADALQAPPRERNEAAHVVPSTTERYIEFLIPGLIGLNILGAGMWGVGFNLVDLRIKNLLRRLVVAPMLRSEFLLAFLLSRLGLVLFDAFAILAFGALVFGVPMNGSWWLLIAVFALACVACSALGLVVASRPQTIEGVSGLMNLVVLPMWLMGGSFFKTSHFPDYFQPLIELMPLTHVNDAIRAVMLDGAGPAEIWPQLLFLAVFSVVGFAVALRIFRWT